MSVALKPQPSILQVSSLCPITRPIRPGRVSLLMLCFVHYICQLLQAKNVRACSLHWQPSCWLLQSNPKPGLRMSDISFCCR